MLDAAMLLPHFYAITPIDARHFSLPLYADAPLAIRRYAYLPNPPLTIHPIGFRCHY